MARRKVNPPDPIVIARVTHRKPKKAHEKRKSKDKDFQNHSRPIIVRSSVCPRFRRAD